MVARPSANAVCSTAATRSRSASDARAAGAAGRFSGPTASGKFPIRRAYGAGSRTVTAKNSRAFQGAVRYRPAMDEDGYFGEPVAARYDQSVAECPGRTW